MFLACIWSGVIPVPTSSQLTKREIDKIENLIEPKLIVAGKNIVLPNSKALVLNESVVAAYNSKKMPPAKTGSPERAAYIVFTSGTSGEPKGVVHAHRAIWARRMMFDDWYGITQNDRLLHSGAFNWTYTLGTGLLDPWTVGATAVVSEKTFNPDDYYKIINKNKITIFSSSPSIFRKILKNEKTLKINSLRHNLSAGEKLSDSIREKWQQRTKTRIYEAFGMSECSTFISQRPNENLTDLQSMGKPQKGRSVAILNEDNNPVGFDEVGNLAIASTDPGCMLCYLGEKQLKQKWLLTNDLAKMSKYGEVTYMGRNDDMLNSGGNRVSPIELENLFSSLEAIDDVAAVDLTIKEDTTIIAIFYIAAEPFEKELKNLSTQKLARYKQPRLFIRVDSFPTSGNGKINRNQLRSQYEANRKNV
jgi:acyl-coenzyme A synthetase/AMP-(fatty) acid ligase